MRRATFSAHLAARQSCLSWGLLSRRLSSSSSEPLPCTLFQDEKGQLQEDKHSWKGEDSYTSFANALCKANLMDASKLAIALEIDSKLAADSKLESSSGGDKIESTNELVTASELATAPETDSTLVAGLRFLKIDAPSPFPLGPLAVSKGKPVIVIVRDPIKSAYDEFLAQVLAANSELRACLIVGAAGIGKSFNTLYLASELMKRKKLFVFHHHARVFAFVPSQGEAVEYTVFETPIEDFRPRQMPALKNRNNFLIYDPPEKAGEAPWDVGAAVVSPCSPNVAHYTQFAQLPDRPKCKFYVPPFTLPELETCFHLRLLPEVSCLEQLRARFFFFGGSLRKINVTNDKAVAGEKKKILEKVLELPSDVAEELFFGTEANDIDAEVASARHSSRLWSYYPENGDIRSDRAGAASEFVKGATLQRYYNTLAYAAGMRNAIHGPSAASPELEKFCGVALSAVGDFEVRKLGKDTSETPSERFAFPVELPIKLLPNFDGLWETLELADPKKPYTLYATSDRNEPVVDFVSAADIAFQITGATAGRHKIAVQSMLNILNATKRARGGKKLRLFLVVPESEFRRAKPQTFEHPMQQATQSAQEYKRECNLKATELQEQIEQWALAIPSSLKQGNMVKTILRRVSERTPVSKKHQFSASMGPEQRISRILEILNGGQPDTLLHIGASRARQIIGHQPWTSLKGLESLLGPSIWKKFLSAYGLDK